MKEERIKPDKMQCEINTIGMVARGIETVKNLDNFNLIVRGPDTRYLS